MDKLAKAPANGGVNLDPAHAMRIAALFSEHNRALVLEAIAAHQAAIRLKPDFIEARFEAGHLLHRTGNLAQAEHAMRELLRIAPGNVHAKLALGAVLVDAGRPEEAEAPLRRALRETADPGLHAQLHLTLGMALRRQRKDEEALAACESAEALTPGRAAPATAPHPWTSGRRKPSSSTDAGTTGRPAPSSAGPPDPAPRAWC